MLPTVEPVIYVHFHYIKTSCFMFRVNYSTTSYVCSAITAVEPLVYVQLNLL